MTPSLQLSRNIDKEMDETQTPSLEEEEGTAETPLQTPQNGDNESEVAAGNDLEEGPEEQFELTPEQLGIEEEPRATVDESVEAAKLAVLEAIVYVTDEPLTVQQIAYALQEPLPEVKRLLDRLTEEFNQPHHGLTVKEVAGGYKMATKAEHHEAVRAFVKNLNPPLKLSLAALETLAVIAYKQPITAPEIMEVRGVQGAGVLKTLLDRKLITSAGRKNVVGKPILYKTTKEFLVQFGLRDLSELPSLKEFEELRRLAFSDAEDEAEHPEQPSPDSPSTAGALDAEQETVDPQPASDNQIKAEA
jgi:segregation and condensation protein B